MAELPLSTLERETRTSRKGKGRAQPKRPWSLLSSSSAADGVVSLSLLHVPLNSPLLVPGTSLLLAQKQTGRVGSFPNRSRRRRELSVRSSFLLPSDHDLLPNHLFPPPHHPSQALINHVQSQEEDEGGGARSSLNSRRSNDRFRRISSPVRRNTLLGELKSTATLPTCLGR